MIRSCRSCRSCQAKKKRGSHRPKGPALTPLDPNASEAEIKAARAARKTAELEDFRARAAKGATVGGFRPFNLMCFDAFWCFFLHISYFVVRCEGRGISGTHHFANAHLRLTRGGFAFRIFLIFFGYWRWRLWHFEFCTISGFHWVVLCLSQLFGKGCLNGYRVSSHIPRSGKRWCNQRNCSWLVLLAVDFSIFLLIFIVQLWYQPWKSPAQLIFTIWLFNIAMENHIF